MSSVAWLWWHHVTAGENFLSEAIALATRVDRMPLVRALAAVPALADPSAIRFVDASTQYHVGTRDHGEGTVDIRLEVRTDAGPAEVWVEAKVGAPLTGQVRTYLNAIEHVRMGPRPELVLLGVNEAYPSAPHLTLVSWQHVHDAVLDSDSPIWHDVRDYLRDCRLALGEQVAT